MSWCDLSLSFPRLLLREQRASVCEVCQGPPHSAIPFSKLKVKSNSLCCVVHVHVYPYTYRFAYTGTYVRKKKRDCNIFLSYDRNRRIRLGRRGHHNKDVAMKFSFLERVREVSILLSRGSSAWTRKVARRTLNHRAGGWRYFRYPSNGTFVFLVVLVSRNRAVQTTFFLSASSPSRIFVLAANILQ